MFPPGWHLGPKYNPSAIPAAGLIGTNTNDEAVAGRVGEYSASTIAVGAAVALTTAASANVTSFSLTPGDWDISGFFDFLMTGATVTLLACGPSLVTGTLPTQAGGSGLGPDALAQDPNPKTTLTGTQQMSAGRIRLQLTATTTVFLVAQATFSVGTVSVYGTLRARRIR